jgi:fibronectin type 3 domain-containing protein
MRLLSNLLASRKNVSQKSKRQRACLFEALEGRQLLSTPATIAPSNLAATPTSFTDIRLSWSDNSTGEEGFKIFRSSDGITYQPFRTVAANSTSFTDSGLVNGTYSYRVTSYVNGGISESDWSNTASATLGTSTPISNPTPAATGGPTATPSNLAAVAVNSTDIRITWTDNSVGEEGFKLFRSSNGVNFVPFRTVGPNSTSFTDAGLAQGTWSYRVTSYTNGGINESGWSNTASATLGNTSGTPVTPIAPDPTPITSNPIVTPSNLAASAAGGTDIKLTWTDNSTGEDGFKIFRSTDNVKFSPFLTVAANSTSYTDRNLAAGTYYYRVTSFIGTSESSWSNTANATLGTTTVTQPPPPTTTGGGTTTTTNPQIPQSAVNAAIAYPLIRFNRSIAGGAYTNQPGNGGAAELLAYAAYTGNTTADSRLLQQIRYTLTGGNEPAANGGYPAQHERHVTTMFVLVKNTARIWNQLSAAEQNKINLIMQATLVGSAFTTSDSNPYVKAGTQQVTLDGDTNVGRDWNSNYREGMLGAVIVAAAYFGPAQAASLLANFNYASFLSQLQSAGLSNEYATFNWKAGNPSSLAPSGTTIQSAVRSYSYYGISANNPAALLSKLTAFTFSTRVNAGLNGGAGYGGAGLILSGASTLPNVGALGQLEEFDASDANGPRSSAVYAYDDLRIHLNNLLPLVITGLYTPSGSDAQLMKVGATDFWYKVDHGYSNYAKGISRGNTYGTDTDKGFEFTRPMWDNVYRAILGV